MHKLNRYGLAVIVAMMVLPAAANAESWICENSNLVREINVVRETGEPVPCSVTYNKKSEGLSTSVLWTANADGAYCDARADGLAEKLQGLGWSCNAF
ncbi:MAG: hypothetical protein PVI70_08385 [Gammaproteobacteria bacterium]|jgi:hypothetical protein